MLEFFLDNYEFLFEVLGFALFAVSAIVLFCKTGDKKYLKEIENKMDKLIYRTPNYSRTEEIKGQDFSDYKPVYRLNQATGELEKTDELICISEFVNANKDVALSATLERLIPQETESQLLSSEHRQLISDIDFLQETRLMTDEYRDKYDLPEDYSDSQVFEFLTEQAALLKVKVDALRSNKKQESVFNETKKNEPQSQPQSVPPDGTQSAPSQSSPQS